LTARSDTGDGLWLLIQPQVSTARLLHPLAMSLARGLSDDNQRAPAAERMRLRVVVHAGELLPDPHGHTGASLNHAARLLDAEATRAVLASSPTADAVLVVSDIVHEGVVRHGYEGIDPDGWQPVQVHVKETSTRAWVHVPGLAAQPHLSVALVAPPAWPASPVLDLLGDDTTAAGMRTVQASPVPSEIWTMGLMADGRAEFQTVHRRDLLLSGVAPLAAMVVGHGRSQGKRDESTVVAFRSMFDQLRHLGQVTSPFAVVPTAIAQTHALSGMARGARPAVHNQMLVLAGRFAEYTGWMTQETGDDRAAVWWTDQAADLAAAGGDDEMVTYALVRRALISLYRHDPIETIALARRAQSNASCRPRILGLAALREAQGHALAGDDAECRRALDRGAVLLDAASQDDGRPVVGTSFVPDPVATTTGWCLHDLGRSEEAAEILLAQLHRLPKRAHRSQARYGVRLALTHASSGDLDQACAVTGGVLDAAERVDSATIRLDLRDLARALNRWRSHRAVREVLPRLTAILHMPIW
jgi:hypothetical protein